MWVATGKLAHVRATIFGYSGSTISDVVGDPCPVVPLASHIGVGDAERHGPPWECLACCTKRSEQSGNACVIL